MNVLQDPLFTVIVAGERVSMSLPQLLADLTTGSDIGSYPLVSAEQRSYWLRFQVRCAARAMRTAGLELAEAGAMPAPELATQLRTALLQHSDVTDWELYQPDPSLPGFLQPPTPTAAAPEADGYRADDCGLLTQIIGTKGHERKVAVGRRLQSELMIYAMLEYQTGVIFGGRGNYESQLTGSRSGAGSGTPYMGAWIDGSYSATFRHDLGVMLDRWDQTAEYQLGPIWALWREPWDGASQIQSVRLDPAFIPLARLIRLDEPMGGVFETVWFHASERSRVNDLTDGGRLGDPYTPLVPDPKGGHMKVRGTLEKGYDYLEVVRSLFGVDGAVRSPSADALLGNPPNLADLRVVFEGMAFEQGKTRGFHRRELRLPRQRSRLMRLPAQLPLIPALHQQMLAQTTKSKRALRSALALLLSHNPLARDSDREKMGVAINSLDTRIDAVYIDFLIDAATSEEGEDATQAYRQWLFDIIVMGRPGQHDSVFANAIRSLPRSVGRQFEDEVRSEAYLRARLRRELDLPYENEAGPEVVA